MIEAEVRLNGDVIEAFLPVEWPLSAVAVAAAEVMPVEGGHHLWLRGCVVTSIGNSEWAWSESQEWTDPPTVSDPLQ